jgi:hypothetical protein
MTNKEQQEIQQLKEEKASETNAYQRRIKKLQTLLEQIQWDSAQQQHDFNKYKETLRQENLEEISQLKYEKAELKAEYDIAIKKNIELKDEINTLKYKISDLEYDKRKLQDKVYDLEDALDSIYED